LSRMALAPFPVLPHEARRYPFPVIPGREANPGPRRRGTPPRFANLGFATGPLGSASSLRCVRDDVESQSIFNPHPQHPDHPPHRPRWRSRR
jgi:hypothetical protein